MAGKKIRGVITVHQARYHQDREIKPCRYIGPKGGKGVMVAQYKDTGDMVLDAQGTPVQWSRAQMNPYEFLSDLKKTPLKNKNPSPLLFILTFLAIWYVITKFLIG